MGRILPIRLGRKFLFDFDEVVQRLKAQKNNSTNSFERKLFSNRSARGSNNGFGL
jgi:hypothetical protein